MRTCMLQVWPTVEEPIRQWGPFAVELLGAGEQQPAAGWTVQHCALRRGGEEQHVMVAQMQWHDMTAQVQRRTCIAQHRSGRCLQYLRPACHNVCHNPLFQQPRATTPVLASRTEMLSDESCPGCTGLSRYCRSMAA